ncbi:MAG TPA: nitrophenyl compound nitroreductase subunit ArsF family protein [Planctomycetota bacterium]|nr:nitrophenyl compound nitroreductase subunit ArsF family protein [Planctomycetota bacterium]
MKIDAKKLLAKLLLAFVLISIGFAIGKEVTLRRVQAGRSDVASATQPAEQGDKVVIYYMHATIRCVTCNSIEAMTAKLIDSAFADAKQAGKLVWKEVDFQENEDLAKRYDVVSSCIVVVHQRDGKQVAFQRLDDVWLLADKPQQFNEYVAKAILAYLGGGQQQ